MTFLLICHVAVCGTGILIGFFGATMSVSECILFKLFDLNRNYKNDKNDANIRKELGHIIHIQMDTLELSISNYLLINRYLFILL